TVRQEWGAIPYGARGLRSAGWYDSQVNFLNFGKAPIFEISKYSEAAVQSVPHFLAFQKRRYRYFYHDFILFPYGSDAPSINGI
ncbi:hypothetical protein Q0P29_14295, partial [Staphylococcus aureus]|nr:hypothetical protein [Staphylococcus aureus]